MIADLVIPGRALADTHTKSRAPAVSEDAALVAGALDGDGTAFRRLVEKYRPLAIRTAYAFLRDRELARDLSQEAFIRVHKSLRAYDPSRSFATWLRRITVNLSIDELRRHSKRMEVPFDEEGRGDNASDPVREAEEAERRRAVWEILDELPPKYRAVMVLREIEGLPTADVAKVIGHPEVSVRWRVHRARRLFRERWVARFGELEP